MLDVVPRKLKTDDLQLFEIRLQTGDQRAQVLWFDATLLKPQFLKCHPSQDPIQTLSSFCADTNLAEVQRRYASLRIKAIEEGFE